MLSSVDADSKCTTTKQTAEEYRLVSCKGQVFISWTPAAHTDPYGGPEGLKSHNTNPTSHNMKTKSHDTNLLIHYCIPVVVFAFVLTLRGTVGLDFADNIDNNQILPSVSHIRGVSSLST